MGYSISGDSGYDTPDSADSDGDGGDAVEIAGERRPASTYGYIAAARGAFGRLIPTSALDLSKNGFLGHEDGYSWRASRWAPTFRTSARSMLTRSLTILANDQD
jgi:hypothetical protein